jgi:hypothetical protein
VNIAEARAELSRPLVFGDERQLLARKFLVDVERCHTKLLACRHCHAEGVLTVPGRRRPDQCDCVRKFDREVIEACGITWIETRDEDVAERRRAGIKVVA